MTITMEDWHVYNDKFNGKNNLPGKKDEEIPNALIFPLLRRLLELIH